MIFIMSFSASFGLCLGYIVAAFVDRWQNNFAISALILIILAIVLKFMCKASNPYFKKDYIIEENSGGTSEAQVPLVRLFMLSGFFVMLPVAIIRYMIQNGSNTLSSVMLMESYEYISPSIGNILNVLIIISGILGSFFARTVVYSKFVNKELTAHLLLVLLALPFMFVLKFVGELPVIVIVISLCVISLLLTGASLFISYYNMSFIKWGRNGTAAGISNAASAVGVVLQSYGFTYIAEKTSWNIVTNLWVIMTALIIVFNLFAAFLAKNFSKNL